MNDLNQFSETATNRFSKEQLLTASLEKFPATMDNTEETLRSTIEMLDSPEGVTGPNINAVWSTKKEYDEFEASKPPSRKTSLYIKR